MRYIILTVLLLCTLAAYADGPTCTQNCGSTRHPVCCVP
jgi:hypothetical protein